MVRLKYANVTEPGDNLIPNADANTMAPCISTWTLMRREIWKPEMHEMNARCDNAMHGWIPVPQAIASHHATDIPDNTPANAANQFQNRMRNPPGIK